MKSKFCMYCRFWKVLWAIAGRNAALGKCTLNNTFVKNDETCNRFEKSDE